MSYYVVKLKEFLLLNETMMRNAEQKEESAKDLIALNETAEAEGFLERMKAYEGQFVDKSPSTIFFSEYFE